MLGLGLGLWCLMPLSTKISQSIYFDQISIIIKHDNSYMYYIVRVLQILSLYVYVYPLNIKYPESPLTHLLAM